MTVAETRDVRGARSNDDRRSVLARSYRGDAAAFLGDLTRANLLLILRAWGAAERGTAMGSKSREELIPIALHLFDDVAAGVPATSAVAKASPPPKLPTQLDALLPDWLVPIAVPPRASARSRRGAPACRRTEGLQLHRRAARSRLSPRMRRHRIARATHSHPQEPDEQRGAPPLPDLPSRCGGSSRTTSSTRDSV